MKKMPQTLHVEKHFRASEVVRDIVIGMSDGLTVPFALAAGLSGAINQANVVITAGLAEIAAGSIAMGLGGYLAARTDAEHYATERATELRETVELPEKEQEEVADVFRSYGLPEQTVATVVKAISSDQNRWVDFMMKFELGLEPPDPKRAGRMRHDHRRLVHCRRAGSAGPVFFLPLGALGADGIRGRHPVGPAGVRLREGAVHGEDADPQRVADRGCRRAGGGGGVLAGKAVQPGVDGRGTPLLRLRPGGFRPDNLQGLLQLVEAAGQLDQAVDADCRGQGRFHRAVLLDEILKLLDRGDGVDQLFGIARGWLFGAGAFLTIDVDPCSVVEPPENDSTVKCGKQA